MKRFLSLPLAALLLVVFAAPAFAADKPVKINTCWMEESAAFNIWYAKKMGWDKEEGLDINMLVFSSGLAQMEALPAKQWSIGMTGTGGQLVGGIRYKIYSVAPIIPDDFIQALYLRPGHPATKVKGYNPGYPDVYGSPETVKGMKILYTAQSNVHYLIGRWLEVLGLKESDVTLVNMEQPSTVPAFEKGIGDGVAIWTPFTFAAEKRGWFKAAANREVGSFTWASIVGDKDWCDKNPELVAKFLRVWFRASNMLREEGSSPRLVAEYQKFMVDFCGIKMDQEDAKKDLENCPRWSYDESLAIIDKSGGPCKAEVWQAQMANFFAGIGRFSPEEIARLEKNDIITDKFMKMVQLPIPDWKK